MTPTRRRGGRRGPGVPINPVVLNQLRIERGLSLADLAGDYVSRAFVHQVVSGKTLPSMDVLRHIAKRLDVMPERLMESDAEGPGGRRGHALEVELLTMARRLERIARSPRQADVHAASLKLVACNLRAGARLVVAAMDARVE